MNEAKNSEPVDKVRIGRVEVAIWKNRGEKGAWHSVTLSRIYKDEDENLKSTNSFSGADILLASEALRLAFEKSRALSR